MISLKEREQIPISFSADNEKERELFEWIQANSLKTAPFIKQLLYAQYLAHKQGIPQTYIAPVVEQTTQEKPHKTNIVKNMFGIK